MLGKRGVWLCLACTILSGQVMAGTVSTVAAIEANGGITLDSAGDIYAANYGDINATSGSRFIWKLSPTDAFEPFVFASDINIASGNDFDSQDFLYQSNFGGDLVSKIDQSGVVTTFATGIDGPVGIVIDSADTVFVNSCLGNRIVQILPDGTSTTFSSSALLNCPNGITQGPNGDLYVINWQDGRILQFTLAGNVSNFASVPSPGGHVTIAGDRLYATSFGVNRIYEFELSGANAGGFIATIGSGNAGSADGSYATSSFNQLNGVTADATGTVLYVTDATGVRKIELEDEVAPPPPPPPAPPPTRSGGGGGSCGWLLAIFGTFLVLRRRHLQAS